jgi:ketosteroid isomerase-like protein
MSEKRLLETVRLLYNEVWAGDLDAAPSVLHPEIVWTAIESAPDAGTRSGYTDCRAYMQDWLDDFELEPFVVEARATTTDGRLVCDQVGAAIGKGSGLRAEIRYGAVYSFSDDGRIRVIHEYATIEDALEAAGLPE